MNLLGPYPPSVRMMLMDSRNYEQLITGSSAVWQSQDVDGTGNGVGGRIANRVFYEIVCCSVPILICPLISTCSGEVHLVVSVFLSRGHVISERVQHKTTGSSHSTFATLMPHRTRCL